MQEGARGIRLAIAGHERVMEGSDMRASTLTLAEGQIVPWHYHTEITDTFFCLEGLTVVETRAPRATHELRPGETCSVPPNTAHVVRGPCKYLLLQGVGTYDNVAVG